MCHAVTVVYPCTCALYMHTASFTPISSCYTFTMSPSFYYYIYNTYAMYTYMYIRTTSAIGRCEPWEWWKVWIAVRPVSDGLLASTPPST